MWPPSTVSQVKPRDSYLKKYCNPKNYQGLELQQIKQYGRQILEVLPHTHTLLPLQCVQHSYFLLHIIFALYFFACCVHGSDCRCFLCLFALPRVPSLHVHSGPEAPPRRRHVLRPPARVQRDRGRWRVSAGRRGERHAGSSIRTAPRLHPVQKDQCEQRAAVELMMCFCFLSKMNLSKPDIDSCRLCPSHSAGLGI